MIVLLAWVYYSAVIVLFGAEVTQVYARCCGSGIRPADHAMPADADAAKPNPSKHADRLGEQDRQPPPGHQPGSHADTRALSGSRQHLGSKETPQCENGRTG